MDAITIVRSAYLAASLIILLVAATPALRTRFLAYGARATPTTTASQEHTSKQGNPYLTDILDILNTWRVPHSWFTSFYAVLVVWTMFWMLQLATRGSAFQMLTSITHDRKTSMAMPQVLLAMTMLLAQGSRRLYECIAFSRPSTSQMWIGHWLFGAAFYIGLPVAAFIEGIPTLKVHSLSISDVRITAPGVRSFIGILLFILASGWQHDCHAYLASLRPNSLSSSKQGQSDYRLPQHPAFSWLVAPHYTAECVIYAALAILTAPHGQWVNVTMLCPLIFTVINLGVTAAMTKTWYAEKFGADAVRHKWSMIPLIM